MKKKPIVAAKTPMIMEMEPGTYHWCACGRSKKQPFCDGSHQGTDFEPMEVIIKEKKKVAWCMCKQSEKKPFCDGAHLKLED